MNIAAVVTDLDGTIVGRDGISATTLAAIAELRVPLIVATARTPAGLAKKPELVPYVRLAICSNGAIGLDPATSTPLWRQDLDPTTTAAICAVLDERLPGAGIGAYNGEVWILDEQYARARGRTPSGENLIRSRSQVAAVRACALGISHPDWGSARIAEMLAEAGIGPELAQISYGAPDVLDVSPPGVDKGTGVLRALAGLGIDPGQTVCFGDAPNDLPMFAVLGRSVAVGNADPVVLAAADQVCPGVEDDGFAVAVRQLGLTTLAALP